MVAQSLQCSILHEKERINDDWRWKDKQAGSYAKSLNKERALWCYVYFVCSRKSARQRLLAKVSKIISICWQSHGYKESRFYWFFNAVEYKNCLALFKEFLITDGTGLALQTAENLRLPSTKNSGIVNTVYRASRVRYSSAHPGGLYQYALTLFT